VCVRVCACVLQLIVVIKKPSIISMHRTPVFSKDSQVSA
jgi:hypothetical protein